MPEHPLIHELADFPWVVRRRDGRFLNLGEIDAPKFADVMRWKLGLGPKDDLLSPRGNEIPARVDDQQPPHPRRGESALHVTWVGHATFLLQFSGLTVLTDPIFSDYCAPVRLPRFRRLQPPGIVRAKLPEADLILISHSHYDHLDEATMRSFGDRTLVFCPAGLGPLLRSWGCNVAAEMTWGETASRGPAQITCLPAQHGSARSLLDRGRTLWCGWQIESGGRRIHFLGDTGYAPFFAEMANRLGQADLALIPIGAYRPQWFMQAIHLNPLEAVRLHLEIRAKRSVAMHWGTFSLADEDPAEPPVLLRQELDRRGIDAASFTVANPGVTFAV